MSLSLLKKLPTFAIACGLLAASSAPAATVLIDLSTAATVSNPAGDGKYWTSMGTGTNSTITETDLIDSSNAATTWDLDITTTSVVSGGTSGAGFGGTGIDGPAGPDPFDEANAITDGIFVNNNSDGTAVFKFYGLAIGIDYSFSLIGGRASNGKDGGIKILSGTPDSNAVDLDVIETDDLLDSYNLLNDGTVLNFTITSIDGGPDGGVIEWEFFKGDNTNGDFGGSTFNALSMTQVPEPSTALLSILGTLLLLRRRR